MKYDRNFFLAIFLSFACIWGWQHFYVKAKYKSIEQQKKEAIAAASHPGQNETTNVPIIMTPAARAAKLQETKRALIDTPELTGSINLTGGRFDNLLLKNYHETIDKNSPQIALLNPLGFQETYFAEFGFVPAQGDIKNLPQSDSKWRLEGSNKLTPSTPLKLVYDNGEGLQFHRTISVDDHYMFTIEDAVTNQSSKPLSLSSYARIARAAPPANASKTYLLHEGLIGILGDQGLKTEKYKDMAKLDPDTKGDKQMAFDTATGGWVGITDKYWAVAAIPDQNQAFDGRFLYFDGGQTPYQADLSLKPMVLEPGQTASVVNHLFAGAKRVDIINAYQKDLKIKKLGLLVDWGFFSFITKPMFALIDGLYKFAGNFGVAILLATVIIKTLLFPLAYKSYKSMARMKKLQPVIASIREKYGDDRVKQQQAMMELYKKEKINPLAGCLPMLVQMPIFFALYKVLYITIEMRHAPFFGWIHDLASKDPTSIVNLFGLLPFHAPAFLAIGAWPIIMGITMFLQMQVNPAPADPAQAVVFAWMPLVFTFMLAAFPAGLVIYWAWNNTLTILQQIIIAKKEGNKIELWDNLRNFFRRKKKTA